MNIKEILNIKLLRSIFKNFTFSTNLSILLLDKSNNIVIQENETDFCFKFHKSNDLAIAKCNLTYLNYKEQLLEKKDIIIDYCEAALLNGYVPIFINNKYLGSIVIGQVIDYKIEMEKIIENAKLYGFDHAKYVEAFKKIKMVKRHEFENNVDFMKNIISIMVELIEGKIKTESRENILNTLINSTPDIICFKDGKGRWLEANDSDLELFALDGVDYRGKTDSELAEYTSEIYRESFLACEKTDEVAWNKGEISRAIEEIPKINGEINIYDVIKVPIFNDKNEREGLVVLGRDITSQKKAEDELYKTQQLKSLGVLAGGIAHDFNNILTSILVSTDIALQLIKDNQEVASLMNDTKKATLRAKKLASQLLTFAKGGYPIKEVVNLKNLITDASNFILSGTSVHVSFDISDEIIYAEVDPSQFNQVIQNLVLNAREEMNNNGEIVVSVKKLESLSSNEVPQLTDIESNFIEIKIKDTGKGISTENLNKIFEPYFTTKESGNGLGLAITHSIVNKHNGYILCDSILNKGTVFTIFLPVGDISNTVKELKTVKKIDFEVINNKNKTILIMDDEFIIRSVAEKLLKYLGYDTLTCKNGEETIEIYKNYMETNKKIDLIIMDLTIPDGIGGEEAIKKILEIDKNVKVIVSTGYSNSLVVSEYKKYGFVGSMSKPFTINELDEVINKALSN